MMGLSRLVLFLSMHVVVTMISSVATDFRNELEWPRRLNE